MSEAREIDHFGDIDASLRRAAAPAASLNAADAFADLDKGDGSFGSILPVAPYTATDALVHGATLGLNEPLRALGTAATRYFTGQSDSFDYPQAEREIQRGRQGYAETNPLANLGANLIGGVGAFAPAATGAVSAVLPATMKAPNLFGQMAKGAAAGAGIGGVTGAADNADSLSNALIGARYGAEIGASLGGVAPAAIRAVPTTLKALRSALDPVAQARPNAIARLRELIASGQKGGGPSTSDIAANLSPGSETMIADVGGRNVQRELGVLYRSNTPASPLVENAMNARDAGAGQRLIGGIDSGVSGGGSAYDALEALQKARQAAAKPLYDTAFSTDRPIYSDRLQQFLSQPELQQGLKLGITTQRREAVAAGTPFNPHDYAIDFNKAGDPVFFGPPNMRTLDAAKAGLDAMLEQYPRNPITGRLQLDRSGRALDQMRQAFVSELDTLNPAYKAARDAWSGPSQSMDALRQGQNFLSLTPAEMRGAVGNLNGSDKEFFKLGAADALRTQVLKTSDGGNEAGSIARSQLARDRLRPLFDNDADFNKFLKVVGDEADYYRTRYATGLNSMTADRSAADAAAAGGGSDSLVWPVTTALMAGKPMAAVGAVAAKAATPLLARARGQTPEAMAELAHILTTTNPAAQQAYLDMLLPLPRQPFPYLAPTSGLLAGRQAIPQTFNGLLIPPPSQGSQY